METMKICCKCGKLMSFNSHFNGYYCTSCGRLEERINLRKACYQAFLGKKAVVYAKQK